MLSLLAHGNPDQQATAIQALAALRDSQYLAAILPFLNSTATGIPALGPVYDREYASLELSQLSHESLSYLTPAHQLPEVLAILKGQPPHIRELLYESCEEALYYAEQSLSAEAYQALVTKTQAYLAQQDTEFRAEVLNKLAYYLESHD